MTWFESWQGQGLFSLLPHLDCLWGLFHRGKATRARSQPVTSI